jgi:Tfp pilus assembly PilM family ATPase
MKWSFSAQRSLPLGIDLGATRVRIAQSEHRSDGSIRLLAVASHAYAHDPVPAITRALAELNTTERRCVFGLHHEQARLAVVHLPRLRPTERRAALVLAAERQLGGDITTSDVRYARSRDDRADWTIALAQRDALDHITTIARKSGLRVVAIDDNRLALRRALDAVDGTIDVGHAQTRLTMYADPLPRSYTIAIGGREITAAISDALSIDADRAETRKRTLGFAGAGLDVRERWFGQLKTAIETLASGHRSSLRRMALVGNGSRIPGLVPQLEACLGISIETNVLGVQTRSTLPMDTLRFATADWALAIGLSRWSAA